MVSKLKIWLITVMLAGLTTGVGAQVPSPLEITTPDPLLPTINRPLTSFERYRISKTVTSLDQEARLKLDQGLPEEAFSLWYRELRLQRALGVLPEIEALGRVGAIAWEENRVADVENITARLDTIAQTTTPDTTILPALGKAYQQTHQLPRAITVYQQLLTLQSGDLAARKITLNQLGELYLARFDYLQAAPIYEELLSLAKAEQDNFQAGLYLQKLAEIYTQALKPENAIEAKEALIATNPPELAQLQLSVAQDYEAIEQLEAASLNYQKAFNTAWAQQHYGLAAQALESLGALYQRSEQNSQAITVYQQLLAVQQQSYDLYGLMNTYDHLGQIYQQEGQIAQARQAFEQGLAIATTLNYRQDYFQSQLKQLD